MSASSEMESTLKEGSPVIQFSVMLQNRAGALSSLVHLLNQRKIVLLGFSVRDSNDATIVRLIVSDPETTSEVFIDRGIPHTQSQMAVIELSEGCVHLADALDALHQAETNIHFAYPLVPGPQGKTLLAFRLEDHEFGCLVLRQAGHKVLYQEDLSR